MDTKGKVISVLKKLGLMPFEDDERVCFFYQMTLYLYVPDSNDPEFLAIYIPPFYETDEDDDELEVMKVMNDAFFGLWTKEFRSSIIYKNMER